LTLSLIFSTGKGQIIPFTTFEGLLAAVKGLGTFGPYAGNAPASPSQTAAAIRKNFRLFVACLLLLLLL
jgi:hypothetical protein